MDRGLVSVLVVDDDEAVCESVAMLLQDSGYEAHTANSVREALAAVVRITYDAILVDAQLGSDSGVRFLQKLAQDRPTAKLVLMSGINLSKSDAFGFRILQKPFERKELLDCVRRAVTNAA